MSDPRTIVITGATGSQGGAIISYLQSNPLPFPTALRATTRNLTSAKSQSLASQGIEVVEADLSSPTSLTRAFKNAWAIFGVTDFFAPFGADPSNPDAAMAIEYEQGVNLARAAAQVETLQHYVWSTLPDSKTLSGGEAAVPHFDAKASVDDYIRGEEKLVGKTTFLWVGAYETNMYIPLFAPIWHKAAGKYIALVPASENTSISPVGSLSNVGLAVHTILSTPPESKNLVLSTRTSSRYILVATSQRTVKEYYNMWADVAGGKTSQNGGEKIDGVEVVRTSLESFEKLYGGFGTEIGVMWKFWEMGGKKSIWRTVHDEDVLVPLDELLEGTEKRVVGLEQAFEGMDWSMM